MTDMILRNAANSRFNLKTASERRAAADSQERDAALQEIRTKTERLKNLRLTKENADKAAAI